MSTLSQDSSDQKKNFFKAPGASISIEIYLVWMLATATWNMEILPAKSFSKILRTN